MHEGHMIEPQRNAFWNIVDALDHSDWIYDYSALVTRIQNHPTRSIADFSEEYRSAVDSAYTDSAWRTGSLLAGYFIGDDSFFYFRKWLVLQGTNVYSMVLNNPDNLCATLMERGLPGSVFIESIEPLEALSLGQKYPDQSEGLKSQCEISELAIKLPRMWELLGDRFTVQPPQLISDQSTDVAGFGLVHVGDKFNHLHGLGPCEVIEILVPETGILKFRFADAERAMRLSTDFFARDQGSAT